MKKIKKKVLFCIFALIMLVLLIIWINNNDELKSEQLTSEISVICGIQRNILVGNLRYDPFKNFIRNMNYEMESIKVIEDRKEWFKEYKEIIKKYQQIIDPPETIYDYFSEEEIEILHRIVESECTGLGFNKKVNVANVIFNRINDERFPNTIEDIVFQKNPIQFSPISDGRYYSVKLEDETLLAIEYAFMFPDTTNGALFFEAIWSEELNYENVMCDGSHKFYK